MQDLWHSTIIASVLGQYISLLSSYSNDGLFHYHQHIKRSKLDDIDDDGKHYDQNKVSHHDQVICQTFFFFSTSGNISCVIHSSGRATPWWKPWNWLGLSFTEFMRGRVDWTKQFDRVGPSLIWFLVDRGSAFILIFNVWLSRSWIQGLMYRELYKARSNEPSRFQENLHTWNMFWAQFSRSKRVWIATKLFLPESKIYCDKT